MGLLGLAGIGGVAWACSEGCWGGLGLQWDWCGRRCYTPLHPSSPSPEKKRGGGRGWRRPARWSTPCEGTYQDASGASRCKDCIPAHQCPRGSSVPLPASCPPGTFIAGSFSSVSDCTDCDAGDVSNGAYTGCTACSGGNYESNNVCYNCPANANSASGSVLTDCLCNAGYTGPDGGPCVQCEADKVQNNYRKCGVHGLSARL